MTLLLNCIRVKVPKVHDLGGGVQLFAEDVSSLSPRRTGGTAEFIKEADIAKAAKVAKAAGGAPFPEILGWLGDEILIELGK